MEIAYCGGQVVQSFKLTAIDVSEENSAHGVELVAAEKSRRAQGSDTCNPSEKSQFRSLGGAASSLLPRRQARHERPVVEDLLEANRVLRFLKMNKVIRLHFEDIGAAACWRISVCMDALWGYAPRRVKSRRHHGLPHWGTSTTSQLSWRKLCPTRRRSWKKS